MSALQNYFDMQAKHDRIFASIARPVRETASDRARRWLDLAARPSVAAGAVAMSPSRRMFGIIGEPLRASQTRIAVPSHTVLDDLTAARKTPFERMLASRRASELYIGGQASRRTIDEALRVRDLTRHALDLATRRSAIDSFMPEWPEPIAAGAAIDVLDDETLDIPSWDWDETVPEWARDFAALVRKQPRAVQLGLYSALVAAVVVLGGRAGVLPAATAQTVQDVLTLLGLVIAILAIHDKKNDDK